MKNLIPFNRPFITKNKSIKLDGLNNFANDGKYTKLCENFLKKKYSAPDIILTHSCTGALEVAALCLNLKKNDEILIPSYTFVSTANAFALRDAKIKFLDVSSSTLNITYEEIRKNITSQTKAIVVVHYNGYSEDIDKISNLAKKKKIILIEDCAHAIFHKFKNRYLGTFGDFSTFSFHETKNIHCGTGGALIINNKKYINNAKIISNKGTNRHQFEKGKASKYKWMNIGSSYKINELSSILLYKNLKNFEFIEKKRTLVCSIYFKNLQELALKGLIKFPLYNRKSNYKSSHIFFFFVKKFLRNKLLKYLNKKKN